MVRTETGEGGERGVGEDRIPIYIDKAPVQPHQGWIGPVVAPSVRPVGQWDFNETKSIYKIVEVICFSKVEVIVVFVRRVASEIEVTNHNPRATNGCSNGRELSKEGLFLIPTYWRVHIRKGELGGI